jgi:hypothetical protein
MLFSLLLFLGRNSDHKLFHVHIINEGGCGIYLWIDHYEKQDAIRERSEELNCDNYL